MNALREFEAGWPLLLAAVLAGGLYATTYYCIGVFVAPWEGEFGWSRSQIAVALSIHPLCLAIAAPVIGSIVDRYGVRRPAFVSLLCMSLAFVAMSAIGPKLWTLYAAVALFAFAGAATTPVLFTRSVIERFDRGRGLALGIAIGASTLTALLAPIAAYELIERVGWRAAWLAFAVLPPLAIPFVHVGLKEVLSIAQGAPGIGPAAVAEQLCGVRLSAALRSRTFWLLALSFFMLTFAVTAALTQMVPILGEIGVLRGTAVKLASTMGLGLMLGRVLGGYIIDRVFAPRVYAAICVVAGAGLALLASGQAEFALMACLCIGVAGGIEFDLLAYLVSRYFGPLEYGRIYGWQWGFSLTGSMVSPVVAGHFLEHAGGYQILLILASALAFLAAFLGLAFGAYPTFVSGRARGGALARASVAVHS